MESDYWCGHVQASVPDALREVRALVAADQKVVVRCVDSQRSSPRIAEAVARHGEVCTAEPEGCVLTCAGLYRLLLAGFFNGFDEIWVLAGTAPATGKLGVAALTSDAVQFDKAAVGDLPGSLRSVGALAVLADGCGLNYATVDPRWARALRRL